MSKLSSFFLGLGGNYKLRTMLLLLIVAVFLSSCMENLFNDPAERLGNAIRLTKGSFDENQIRFHPNEDKLLFLRLSAKDGKSVEETNQPLVRRIMEIDFSNPDYSKVTEIKALSGGSYPSYSGSKRIFALDQTGGTVFLEEGEDKPSPIDFTGLNTRPTKPIASPDGKYVAFLSIPAPKINKDTDVTDEENFRYQAFVASVETGEVKQLSRPIGLHASVVSLSWADDGLLVTYQIFERTGLYTRVEKLVWPDGKRMLALFADVPPNLSLDDDYRFFVTHMKKAQHVSLISRGMDIVKEIDFKAPIKSAIVQHDGKYVVVSRYCEDTKGYNLYLLPVDGEFLKAVSGEGGD